MRLAHLGAPSTSSGFGAAAQRGPDQSRDMAPATLIEPRPYIPFDRAGVQPALSSALSLAQSSERNLRPSGWGGWYSKLRTARSRLYGQLRQRQRIHFCFKNQFIFAAKEHSAEKVVNILRLDPPAPTPLTVIGCNKFRSGHQPHSRYRGRCPSRCPGSLLGRHRGAVLTAGTRSAKAYV